MGFLISGTVSSNTNEIDTVPTQAVGTVLEGSDGFYEYVKFTATASNGHYVVITGTGDASGITTTNAGSTYQKVGVAQADVTVANTYGWVWRGNGTSLGIVANGVAAGNLTTTATAGVLGSGGTAVQGARSLAAGVTNTRVAVTAATLMTVNV